MRAATDTDVAVLDVRMPVLEGSGAAEEFLHASSPTRVPITHHIRRAERHGRPGVIPYAEPVAERDPIAVGITADGPQLTSTRDGKKVGA